MNKLNMNAVYGKFWPAEHRLSPRGGYEPWLQSNAWTRYGRLRNAIAHLSPAPVGLPRPDARRLTADALLVWLDACEEAGCLALHPNTPDTDEGLYVREVAGRTLLLPPSDARARLHAVGPWPHVAFVTECEAEGPYQWDAPCETYRRAPRVLCAPRTLDDRWGRRGRSSPSWLVTRFLFV